jgi:hypothetical protein
MFKQFLQHIARMSMIFSVLMALPLGAQVLKGSTPSPVTTAADLVSDSFSGVVVDKQSKAVPVTAFRSADLAPGESFSGTIAADGVDQGELSGIVFEVVEKSTTGHETVVTKTPVSSGIYEGVVPVAAVAGGSVIFSRLIKDGKTVGDSTPTKVVEKPKTGTTGGGGGGDSERKHVKFPEVMQAGRPATIHLHGGDGEMTGTKIAVNKKAVKELAEGPREAIFRAPMDETGPVTVSYTKDGVTESGPSRIVAISMKAVSHELLTGVDEAVRTTVTGLAGIDKPLSLLMVNSTPNVELEGGNRQTITIAPSEIAEDGSYTYDRIIYAEHAGNFHLTDTLYVPGEEWPCGYGDPEYIGDKNKECKAVCKRTFYYFDPKAKGPGGKPKNYNPRDPKITMVHKEMGNEKSEDIHPSDTDKVMDDRYNKMSKDGYDDALAKEQDWKDNGNVTQACPKATCACYAKPPDWTKEPANPGTDTLDISHKYAGSGVSGDATWTYQFDYSKKKEVAGACGPTT